MENLQLEPDLAYPEHPVRIVSRLGLPGIRLAISIRCSGATTPSEKRRGKLKSFSNPNIRNYFKPIKVLTNFYLFNLALH